MEPNQPYSRNSNRFRKAGRHRPQLQTTFGHDVEPVPPAPANYPIALQDPMPTAPSQPGLSPALPAEQPGKVEQEMLMATPPETGQNPPLPLEAAQHPWLASPEAMSAAQETAPKFEKRPTAFLLPANKIGNYGRRPLAAGKAGAKGTPTKPAALSAAAGADLAAKTAELVVSKPPAQPQPASAPARIPIATRNPPASSTLSSRQKSRWGPEELEEQQTQQQQQQQSAPKPGPKAASKGGPQAPGGPHASSPAPVDESSSASSSSDSSSSSSSSSSASREDGEASPVATRHPVSRGYKESSHPRAPSPRRDSRGQDAYREDRDYYRGDRDSYKEPRDRRKQDREHRKSYDSYGSRERSEDPGRRPYTLQPSHRPPRHTPPGYDSHRAYQEPGYDEPDRRERRRHERSDREHRRSGGQERRPSRFSHESSAQEAKPQRPSSSRRDEDRRRPRGPRPYSSERQGARNASGERSRREAPDAARDRTQDGPQVQYGARRSERTPAQPPAAHTSELETVQLAKPEIGEQVPEVMAEQHDSKAEPEPEADSKPDVTAPTEGPALLRTPVPLVPEQQMVQTAESPVQTPPGSAQLGLMSLLGGYGSDTPAQRSPASPQRSEPPMPPRPAAHAASPHKPPAAQSRAEAAATPPAHPQAATRRQAAPAQALTPESARIRLTFAKPKPRPPIPLLGMLDPPEASPTAAPEAESLQGSQPSQEAADKVEPIEAPPAPAHEEAAASPKSPGVPIEAPPAPPHDEGLTSKQAQRRARMAQLAAKARDSSGRPLSASTVASEARTLSAAPAEPDVPASPDAPARISPPASPDRQVASPDPSEVPPGVSPPALRAAASHSPPPPPPPSGAPAAAAPALPAYADPANYAAIVAAAASHGYTAQGHPHLQPHHPYPASSAAAPYYASDYGRQPWQHPGPHQPQEPGRYSDRSRGPSSKPSWGAGWGREGDGDRGSMQHDRDTRYDRAHRGAPRRDKPHDSHYQDSHYQSRYPEPYREQRDREYERDRQRDRDREYERARERDRRPRARSRGHDRPRSGRDERSMSIDTDDQSEGRRSRDRGRSRGRSGDADLPPQLTPAELARQQAAQRAADAQSRSAQELKDVSAAFQELLPLCARIIPHWQQHADTPEGRQAAYLHMYKWRSSWKEGVHAGPQCSFADWDGDASDPVNFPMAAAAAAEPSPLAKFQALLPGLPLDWQVPLIADLAKAPVPLEVQNKPMEELTGEAVSVSWEATAEEVADPRSKPEPGHRPGPDVVPVPWFAWLREEVDLVDSDAESNDSWSDQLNKPAKGLTSKSAGPAKQPSLPLQPQPKQEQQQQQGHTVQQPPAQQPEQQPASTAAAQQAQPATLQSLQRWLQEAGAAGKQRRRSLFPTEASPAGAHEPAENARCSPQGLQEAAVPEELTAWLTAAHQAAEQAIESAALFAKLEGRSPPHAPTAAAPPAQAPTATAGPPAKEVPARPAAADHPEAPQGAPGVRRPARRTPSPSASPVSISSTSSGSRSPASTHREGSPGQQAASEPSQAAQSKAAAELISARISAALSARLAQPPPAEAAAAPVVVPASDAQAPAAPVPGSAESKPVADQGEPAAAPLGLQGPPEQQTGGSVEDEPLEQGEIGDSPPAQLAELPAGAAADAVPPAQPQPAATPAPPVAATSRATAIPDIASSPASQPTAAAAGDDTAQHLANGSLTQPAEQDQPMPDAGLLQAPAPAPELAVSPSQPNVSKLGAAQPSQLPVEPDPQPQVQTQAEPQTAAEASESPPPRRRPAVAEPETSSETFEPRAKPAARSAKSVSGKRRPSATSATSGQPLPKRRGNVKAAAEVSEEEEEDSAEELKQSHRASRVKATAQALLKSILKDLVSADQKDAEGIFSQPAPVGLKGYQELCPRPMSLQEIRRKVDKDLYTFDADGIDGLHADAECMADNCIRYWQPQNADKWREYFDPGDDAVSLASGYVNCGEVMKVRAAKACRDGVNRVKYEAAKD